MTAKNACEGVMFNPQLKGAINALVRSVYNRYRDLMTDSAYDQEDLFQELMLELCEEKPQSSDAHYQRRATDRLKNIIRNLSRELTDYNGERVSFVPLEEVDA